jgi:deoxycytidylate deaminase
MQNKQFPVQARIFNQKTNEKNPIFKNQGNIYHAEILAINNLNETTKHINTNKNFGIEVNLFPCRSCLEYIQQNRITCIHFEHNNFKNQSKRAIETILEHKITIIKKKPKDDKKIFQEYFKNKKQGII